MKKTKRACLCQLDPQRPPITPQQQAAVHTAVRVKAVTRHQWGGRGREEEEEEEAEEKKKKKQKKKQKKKKKKRGQRPVQ